MSRCRSWKVLGFCGASALFFLAVPIQPVAADDTAPAFDVSNPAKNLAQMNCGATIGVLGADGGVVSSGTTKGKANVAALILDDDTLSYPLEEGETTLLITFPKVSLLDRFTFVNE